MFKNILITLLVFVTGLGFGQRAFPTAPEQFSKIRFTYIQKSKLFIDDTGVYADTVVLKRSFPKHKIQKKETSGTYYGFIPIAELSEKERKTLIGIYSHLNFQINGEYNVSKQKTTLKCKRIKAIPDDIRMTLQRVFGETYGEEFHKEIVSDFKTNERWIESGMIEKKSHIRIDANRLRWQDDEQKYGLYEENNGTKFTNAAFIEKELNQFITPLSPFENCPYGISKIESQLYTIELIEVTYE